MTAPGVFGLTVGDKDELPVLGTDTKTGKPIASMGIDETTGKPWIRTNESPAVPLLVDADPTQVQSIVDETISTNLGNVDNTADVDKPVSAPQASALATKASTDALQALASVLKPVVVVDPQPTTIKLTQSGKISCIAGVCPNTSVGVSYQWIRQGVESPGTNSRDLVFTSPSIDESGDYSCRIANEYGSETSSAARVNIVADPSVLFGDDDNGIVIDFSDRGSLFVDHEGTIPVTGVGDTVGRILDLSGKNNHLYQVTESKRGVYARHPSSGLRNLLSHTDVLDTQTIDVLAGQHTISFTGAGTVTLSGVASGTFSGSPTNDTVANFTATAGALTITVSGDVRLAQIEVGAARTAYQSARGLYDVTQEGESDVYYLRMDGVDDCYRSVVNLNISATDEMTASFACCAFGSSVQVLFEHGLNFSDTGIFAIYERFSANTVAARSQGTLTVSGTSSATHPPGTVRLHRLETKIGIDKLELHVNKAIAVTSSADQGSGNYVSRTFNFGARNQNTLFFKGRIYGGFIINKLLSADMLGLFESEFTARKAGLV